MSLLKRFIIVNIILISGLLFYLSYLSLYPQGATQSPEKNEVLAATTQEFNSFALATINQYPVISYPDGRSVPFQDRFAIIRKYSSPSKFTNHLCNSINEASAAWKNGTSCTVYTTYNPTFIKLNFGNSEKLMLYAYYGLHAVNSETNTVEWQSAHIDRIQNPTAVYNECLRWTYDPSSVIPVKSGSNFYLFSKFNGHNDSRCLQFYDEYTNRASYSQANGKLYLGYEINSDGKLNTKSYTRTTVAPYTNLAGGPFGPGPKNATLFSTLATPDIYGCRAYDKDKNCISLQGVALQNVTTVPVKSIKGTCKWWGKIVQESVKCTYGGAFTEDGEILSMSNLGCNPSSGQHPACPAGYGCYYTKEPTGAEYRNCAEYNYTTVPGSFKTAVNSPIFSNFKDFNPNLKTWNTNSTATPADYNQYKDETATNSTANALNFTKDLNSSVFTSNNYMFKVTVPSVGKLNVKRYPLNTTTYNPGSSSYIQTSTYSTDLTLGSTANTKYSLHFNQNDIYLMAAGNTTFNFWKLANLNSKTGTVGSVSDLSTELRSKITIGTPKAFGIVSGKVYVITANQVYFATIGGGTPEIETPEDSNYGNFEVNGNVYTKTDLTEKFIVTNPSKKLEGNFITTAPTSGANLKSLKNASIKFDYPTILPKTLFNFTVYSNSLNKFNLLVGSSTAEDPNPLAPSNYVSISPTSDKNFEIIYISQNKGVKIDLNNANLNNPNFKLDKYIFVNLDKDNNSRINFTIDCTNNAAYSVICTAGNKFYMKGALLGQFTITGSILDTMTTTRFINVSENPDLLLNIIPDLRLKKYPMVTTSKVYLKYSQ